MQVKNTKTIPFIFALVLIGAVLFIFFIVWERKTAGAALGEKVAGLNSRIGQSGVVESVSQQELAQESKDSSQDSYRNGDVREASNQWLDQEFGSGQPTPNFTALIPMKPDEVPNPILDKGSVGKGFPISRSVLPNCTPNSGGTDCEDLQRLDAFSSEPRDLAWARQAEEILRNNIHQQDQEFRIRGLECRLVTCVLEVESLAGQLHSRRSLQPAGWYEAHAKPFGYRIGLESDALGRRVTVSLRIYQRIH